LRDENGKAEFNSENWNSDSVYFKDAAGNVLEFIARHRLKKVVDGDFDGEQILNISEIGLPSENVIGFVNELCASLNLSVFKQQPNETFTPVGDDNGLFILPIKNRIWIPNSGVPAKLLPVKVTGDTNGKEWEVHGVPKRSFPTRHLYFLSHGLGFDDSKLIEHNARPSIYKRIRDIPYCPEFNLPAL